MVELALECEAAFRDPVGVGNEREAGGFERIRRTGRGGAEDIPAAMPQRADRAAQRGKQRRLPTGGGDGRRAQPSISSSSRPRVSLTRARTKKKEMKAESA